MAMAAKIGAIEAGGTKCVYGYANGDNSGLLVNRRSCPTTASPEETCAPMIKYFKDQKVSKIGLASFGPVQLDKSAPQYGFITNTPKPGWQNFDFVGLLERELGVPVFFDTDVGAAALGELYWGAAKGLDSALYLTVGTGIGGGAVISGSILHGALHPEMGHVRVERQAGDDFKSLCPFHDECLEGLASGIAIKARWGADGRELSDREEVWDLEAFYLAQAIVDYILILSPKKIILGGGVMKQAQLFPLIRAKVLSRLGGYVQIPELEPDNINSYITFPGLGDNAGIMGAIALTLERQQRQR